MVRRRNIAKQQENNNTVNPIIIGGGGDNIDLIPYATLWRKMNNQTGVPCKHFEKAWKNGGALGTGESLPLHSGEFTDWVSTSLRDMGKPITSAKLLARSNGHEGLFAFLHRIKKRYLLKLKKNFKQMKK